MKRNSTSSGKYHQEISSYDYILKYSIKAQLGHHSCRILPIAQLPTHTAPSHSQLNTEHSATTAKATTCPYIFHQPHPLPLPSPVFPKCTRFSASRDKLSSIHSTLHTDSTCPPQTPSHPSPVQHHLANSALAVSPLTAHPIPLSLSLHNIPPATSSRRTLVPTLPSQRARRQRGHPPTPPPTPRPHIPQAPTGPRIMVWSVSRRE